MANKYLSESELKTLERCYALINDYYSILAQDEHDEHVLYEDLLNIKEMYNRFKGEEQ